MGHPSEDRAVQQSNRQSLIPEDLVISTYWAPWQKHSGWSQVTEAGVCLVHRPTGAMVKVDTERNAHLNKAIALEMLETKVSEIQAQRNAIPQFTQEDLNLLGMVASYVGRQESPYCAQDLLTLQKKIAFFVM